MEKILCAAIWYFNETSPIHSPKTPIENKGLVLCGFRHYQIISQFFALTGQSSTSNNCVQGFLTSCDRFVDRKDAAKIAFAAGQIDNEVKMLISEGLY